MSKRNPLVRGPRPKPVVRGVVVSRNMKNQQEIFLQNVALHWKEAVLAAVVGIGAGIALRIGFDALDTSSTAQTLATVFAAAIGAGSALAASTLTGKQIRRVEEEKRLLEVEAIKTGIVEELLAFIQAMHAATTAGYYPVDFTLSITPNNLPASERFPVYIRSAGTVALAGSEFTSATILTHSIIATAKRPNALDLYYDLRSTRDVIHAFSKAASLLPGESDTLVRSRYAIRAYVEYLNRLVSGGRGKTIRLEEPDATALNELLAAEDFGELEGARYRLAPQAPADANGNPTWTPVPLEMPNQEENG